MQSVIAITKILQDNTKIIIFNNEQRIHFGVQIYLYSPIARIDCSEVVVQVRVSNPIKNRDCLKTNFNSKLMLF